MQIPLDLNWEELAIKFGTIAIRVCVILIAALAASRILRRLLRGFGSRIERSMEHGADLAASERRKRVSTLTSLGARTVSIVVWVLAIVMALKEGGFDIGPLLAGAGVIGLAIGFGAQNLVRDVISGIINGTGGAVEQINLRTTVLRDLEGSVHIFPNGTITTLTNKTQEFSHYVFDIGVAYKEDTDRVVQVLQEIGDSMRKEEEWEHLMLEPLEVMGVDKFADSAVIIKMRIKTQPGQQWAVGRQLNRRIKKRFDAEGIEIPFPHRSLYFGEASAAFKLKLDDDSREEIRAIVREEVVAAKKSAD
jgi:small conductance mechanosensitive channel